ncbi:MAG: hypothetical protein ACE5JP_01620, partial [Candidatus Bipolaricaulia bacterium]
GEDRPSLHLLQILRNYRRYSPGGTHSMLTYDLYQANLLSLMQHGHVAVVEMTLTQSSLGRSNLGRPRLPPERWAGP